MKIAERNNSIDIFRLICAGLIVMIHAELFSDTSIVLFTIFEHLGRFALPAFFCIAGYYYINSLQSGKKPFKKTLFNLLRPYILWTIVYYLLSATINIANGDIQIGEFLKERVIYFFVNGSYYHLWYFPAVIYSLIIVTVFWRFFGIKGIKIFAVIAIALYIVGSLGSTYLFFGNRIKIFSALYSNEWFDEFKHIVCMAFAFFSMPVFIINRKLRIKPLLFLLASIVFFIGEIAFHILTAGFNANSEMLISAYILPLAAINYLLQNPTKGSKSVSRYSRNTSMLMYYIHPLVIIFITVIIPTNTIIVYLLTMILCLAAGAVLTRFPSTFSILLEGRFKRSTKVSKNE